MKVTAIAAGSEHALALTDGGRVVSWGNGPRVPEGLERVVAVAAGNFASFALRVDGTVVGWGATDVPQDLPHVVDIVAGGGVAFALHADDSVTGWGRRSPIDQFSTIAWAGDDDPVAVSQGGGFALSISANGTLGHHVLGSFIEGDVPRPPEEARSGVTAVAAGFAHAIALVDGRGVVTWGWPEQISSANLFTPENLADVSDVAAGGAFSMALRSDGAVVAWGHNEYGQTDVPDGLDRVTRIAAGTHFALALRADGTVSAWGRNNVGQTDVPGAIAGSSAPEGPADVVRPFTLSKDLSPKALLTRGSPDEDVEMTVSRLPGEDALLETIASMERIRDAPTMMHEARRAIACSYNNIAARRMTSGSREELEVAVAALAEADRVFASIPGSSDLRVQARLVRIPIARAVLRINIANALIQMGDLDHVPVILEEAREFVRVMRASDFSPAKLGASAEARQDEHVAHALEVLSKRDRRPAHSPKRAPHPPLPEAKSGGCFIATAVYGSYDAPQVLVLREFRDRRLACSRAGRAAIRCYYALSPTLVRVVGRQLTLSRLARRILDRIVVRVARLAK